MNFAIAIRRNSPADAMVDVNTNRKLVRILAVGEYGYALDRGCQETAARDPLLIAAIRRAPLRRIVQE